MQILKDSSLYVLKLRPRISHALLCEVLEAIQEIGTAISSTTLESAFQKRKKKITNRSFSPQNSLTVYPGDNEIQVNMKIRVQENVVEWRSLKYDL